MTDRLWFLIPEFILLAGVVVCVISGLASSAAIRRRVGFITCLFLAAAAISIPFVYTPERVDVADTLLPALGGYIKMSVAIIGILLVMTAGGMMDREYEQAIAKGKNRFSALRVSGGEFHSLLLLSITGVMLICEARDLIWLFLALELVSLPTYVMIAISRWSRVGQEAAMKYFFLGALASGLTLYGFAMLYAATGTLVLSEMVDVFAIQQGATGEITPFGQLGLLLVIFGLCYKIAAAPMHIYAPDVYQGAASPVTAFLAFIPKTAGMIALILTLSLVGWEDGLPPVLEMSLWVIAVLTMLLGNIGALLQSSAKRMLGYSSIAHSGYMLIGVIAGPPYGLVAVLVYLVIYGATNTGAFATLAGLSVDGKSVDSLEEISGLHRRSPIAAATMAISCGSLLGIPPLFGFWGKLLLFIAGISTGQLSLVIIAVITSAISAWYYLRLIGVSLLSSTSPRSESLIVALRWPIIAAVISAIIAIAGPLLLTDIVADAQRAVHTSNE